MAEAIDYDKLPTLNLAGGGGAPGEPIDYDKLPTLDMGIPPPPPPPPRGLLSEFGTALTRSAYQNVADPAVRGFSSLVQAGAEAVGAPQGVQDWIARDVQRQAETRARNEKELAPSVPLVTDIDSAGNFGRFVASTAGEALPVVAGFVSGGPRIGLGIMSALGGAAGGYRAEDKYHDPGATAYGAGLGVASNLVPGSVIFGQAGRGALRTAGIGAGTMGAQGALTPYAEAVEGPIAGKEYETPDWRVAATGGVTGAMTGAAMGAVVGRKPGVSAEVQAALDEALGTKKAPLTQAPPANEIAGTVPPPTGEVPAPPKGPDISYQPGQAGGARFTIGGAEGATPSELVVPLTGEGLRVPQLRTILKQLLPDEKQTINRMKLADLRTRYDDEIARYQADYQATQEAEALTSAAPPAASTGEVVYPPPRQPRPPAPEGETIVPPVGESPTVVGPEGGFTMGPGAAPGTDTFGNVGATQHQIRSETAPAAEAPPTPEAARPIDPAEPKVVGDYVQWTSGGQDQFAQPVKIVRFLDDRHAQVEGSNTGIPVDELTLVRRGEGPLRKAPEAEPAVETSAGGLRMKVSETDLPTPEPTDAGHVFLDWDTPRNGVPTPVAGAYLIFRDGGRTGYIESVSSAGGKGVSRHGAIVMGGEPGALGPGTVREMARQIFEQYPQLERIEGIRMSGARAEQAPVSVTRDQVIRPETVAPTEEAAPRAALVSEPDDAHPGQHVAKEADQVVGKGASPEAAIADAERRGRVPYPIEPPPTKAKVQTKTEAIRERAAKVKAERTTTVGEKPLAPAKPGTLRKRAEAPEKKPEVEITEETKAETAPTEEAEAPGARRAEPGLAEEKARDARLDMPESEKPGMAQSDFDVLAGKTTGKVRKTPKNKPDLLRDLEDRLYNNEIDLPGAIREYGSSQPGKKQRTVKDFAAHLHRRIREAPAAEKRVLDEMNKVQNDRTRSAESRKAQIRELDAELSKHSPERIEWLTEQLKAASRTETKVEVAEPATKKIETAAERLRATREKLEADRAAKKSGEPLDMPEGWDTADTSTETTARNRLEEIEQHYKRPEINRAVEELLRGPARSAREHMRRIANDPVIKRDLPEVAALAVRLERLLPEHVKVYRPTEASRAFPDRAQYHHRGVAGMFDPVTDSIVIPRSNRSRLESVMHETLHAITKHHLDRLGVERYSPGYQKEIGITDIRYGETVTTKVLDAIEAEIRRQSPNLPDHGDLHYALTSHHELHTMLMTSPAIRRIVSEMTPGAEFRKTMAELGYAPRETSNLVKTFTGWVRRVLGLSERQVSDNLLEHITRPIEDITAEAGYRDRRRPDPNLRTVQDMPAAARELQDVLDLPKLDKETFTKALRALDLGRRGDMGRRAILAASNLDDIIEWHKNLLPGLSKVRDAKEAETAATKEFHDTHAPAVQKLNSDYAKLPVAEQDRLAQLRNDATIADVKLGPNADNSHLKSRADLTELTELQKRYDGLSDAAKAHYHAATEHHTKLYTIERAAELEAAIKLGLPDVTPAQAEALRQQVKTKRGLNQLVNDPNNTGVAKAFAEKWATQGAMARQIGKSYEKGWVNGDFFPLRRFGEYVVHYGDKKAKDGSYGVEMFENKRDAEIRRADLEREGVEPSQVLAKQQSKLREHVPVAVMRDLDLAIEKHGGFTEAQRQAVHDNFALIEMQHATRSAAARTALRRQGVKGASKEVSRITSSDFLSLASRIGYLKHKADVTNAIADQRREIELMGRQGKRNEQVRAEAAIQEIEKRSGHTDNYSSRWEGAKTALTTLGFAKSLLSFSRILTETLSTQATAASVIGGRHGFTRSTFELGKALAQITPKLTVAGGKGSMKALGGQLKAADWNMSIMARNAFQKANPRMADAYERLFRAANNAGLIDHTIVREMQRIARGRHDVVTNWTDRFLDSTTYMAHASDVINKSVALKAAFDLEMGHKSNNGNEAAAIQYAIDRVLRRTTPNYNLTNKSRLSSGQALFGGHDAPFMPILTQFKQYGFFMYGLLGNLTREMVKGKTRAERYEAGKTLAGLVASHMLIAGVEGSILADLLRYGGGAYDLLFEDYDKPHNYMNDVRDWLDDNFGTQVAEHIAKGPVGVGLGIDIHRRTGMANAAGIPELNSFADPKAYMLMLGSAATGAAGQDVTEMAAGMSHLRQGNYGKAFEAMFPVRLLADLHKAYALNERGVTDSKGDTIMGRDRLSNWDIAMQAAGFQPEPVSEFREVRSRYYETRDEIAGTKSKIMHRWVNNPDARGDTRGDIDEFNQAHPQNRIRYQDLSRAVKAQREKERNADIGGVQVSRKTRRMYEEQAAPFNVPGR